jgi:putative transposase
VGYDLHDANRVWVRNKAGQIICVAEFEANKRSYFPESFIQQAAQKRAEGRIKRAEAKIEEAQAELDAPLLLEQQTVFEMPGMTINAPRENDHLEKVSVQVGKTSQAEVIELPKKAARPMFDTQAAKYRWLLENHREITNEDEAWLDYYRVTAEWEELFGDKEVATR